MENRTNSSKTRENPTKPSEEAALPSAKTVPKEIPTKPSDRAPAMHEPTQLDLFQKPAISIARGAYNNPVGDPPRAANAALHPFPFARRRPLVEATAQRLLSCSGRRAKQAEWDLVVMSVADEVRRFGRSEGDVVRELCAFHDAVDQAIHEMRRINAIRGTR